MRLQLPLQPLHPSTPSRSSPPATPQRAERQSPARVTLSFRAYRAGWGRRASGVEGREGMSEGRGGEGQPGSHELLFHSSAHCTPPRGATHRAPFIKFAEGKVTGRPWRRWHCMTPVAPACRSSTSSWKVDFFFSIHETHSWPLTSSAKCQVPANPTGNDDVTV